VSAIARAAACVILLAAVSSAGCQVGPRAVSRQDAITAAKLGSQSGPVSRSDAKLVPYGTIREALGYPPGVQGQPSDSETVWAVALSPRSGAPRWIVVIVRQTDGNVMGYENRSGTAWPPFWEGM